MAITTNGTLFRAELYSKFEFFIDSVELDWREPAHRTETSVLRPDER